MASEKESSHIAQYVIDSVTNSYTYDGAHFIEFSFSTI